MVATPRHTIEQAVKYRRPGRDDWSDATAVNISASGLLFKTCTEIPEVGANLEMYFADEDPGLVLTGRVARRVLHCWPDPCVQVAVQFAGPEGGLLQAGANAGTAGKVKIKVSKQ